MLTSAVTVLIMHFTVGKSDCNYVLYETLRLPLIDGECGYSTNPRSGFTGIMANCDSQEIYFYNDMACTDLVESVRSSQYSCDNSGSCDGIRYRQYDYDGLDCTGNITYEEELKIPPVSDNCFDVGIFRILLTTTVDEVRFEAYSSANCTGSSLAEFVYQDGHCESFIPQGTSYQILLDPIVSPTPSPTPRPTPNPTPQPVLSPTISPTKCDHEAYTEGDACNEAMKCNGDVCDCTDDSEEPNCRVCQNEYIGCSQCLNGYFGLRDKSIPCQNCELTFGDGCMFCADGTGCQQCKQGYNRALDNTCGVYYCVDLSCDVTVNTPYPTKVSDSESDCDNTVYYTGKACENACSSGECNCYDSKEDPYCRVCQPAQDYSTGNCAQCDQGYFDLNNDKKYPCENCQTMFGNECLHCERKGCQQCEQGYVLVTDSECDDVQYCISQECQDQAS